MTEDMEENLGEDINVGDFTDVPMEEESPLKKYKIPIAVGAAAVLIAIIVAIRIKKKKKARQEEGLDDEIS